MNEQLIDRLIELAQRQRDEAIAALTKAQTQAQRAHEILDSLYEYRTTLQSKGLEAARGGLAIDSLVRRFSFEDRVAAAIREQHARIDQIESERGQQLARARKAQRRLGSFEALRERQLRRHRAAQQAAESRSADELCALMVQRRTQEEHR